MISPKKWPRILSGSLGGATGAMVGFVIVDSYLLVYQLIAPNIGPTFIHPTLVEDALVRSALGGALGGLLGLLLSAEYTPRVAFWLSLLVGCCISLFCIPHPMAIWE